MAKKKNFKTPFVVTNMKSVVENLTTVHGTAWFSLTKGAGLCLWTILMAGNLLLTAGFLMVVQRKYYDDQIVTEINNYCRVDQAPFPAVSVCNFNVVSVRETKNIHRILLLYDRTEQEINGFFQALPSLNSYGLYSDRKENFTEIMNILKRHYFTVDTIMEEVHQKCEDLLLHCSFNRKVKNCSDVFHLVKTYEGHCCTFNYAALNDGSENPLSLHDEDFDYYYDDADDKTTTARMVATSESGRLSGLFAVLNVEPDQYPPWSHVPYYGAKILICDPNDYPETSVAYNYLSTEETLDIKVTPMVFQTENALRRLEPARRNCWFHDEVPLEHTERYSFETCYSECKMATFLENCNCVPYKYPRDKQTRICELEDLKCLHNVTVYISAHEMTCDPICYIECSDKKYSVSSDKTTFVSESVPVHIAKHHNLSHLSGLHVYYTKSTCNCYKLTVLVDFSYFIATYGGVFSLSFGGSIVTLIELLYLTVNYIVMNIICIAKYLKKTMLL